MITFVSFQHPVNIIAQGADYWSATDDKHKGITCTDKGNHLAFEYTVNSKDGPVAKRTRVPLTNIAFVTEDADESKKPAKSKAEVAP